MKSRCAWLLVAILLCACTAASTPEPVPTTLPPTNTPKPVPTIMPGSMAILPLDPAGTPEVHPMLVVEATIADIESGQPVYADVYIVESEKYREPVPGERMLAGSVSFEITRLDELDGWLVVKAPGYEVWKIRIQYHIPTSRRLWGPVQLTPKKPLRRPHAASFSRLKG